MPINTGGGGKDTWSDKAIFLLMYGKIKMGRMNEEILSKIGTKKTDL